MSVTVTALAHSAVGFEGHTVFLVPGKPYAPDDPLVVAFPHMFTEPEPAEGPQRPEPFRHRERGR